MKVIAHRRQNKWASLEFTIRQIDRETLSLLLLLAQDGCNTDANRGKYDNISQLAKKIDAYINNEDAMVRLTPLKLSKTGQPLIDIL